MDLEPILSFLISYLSSVNILTMCDYFSKKILILYLLNYYYYLIIIDIIFYINFYFLMFDQVVLLSQNQQSQYIRYSQSPASAQSPPAQIRKRIKKRGRRKKELSNMNIGHWTSQEKQKYYNFVQEHIDLFAKKQSRRSDKIFKVMSLQIITRSPDQCRSHHQKMQKRYKTIEMILENLKPFYLNQCQKKKETKESISQKPEDTQAKNLIFDYFTSNANQQLQPLNVPQKSNEDLKQTYDQEEEDKIDHYANQQEEYRIWDQIELSVDYINMFGDQIF